MHRTPNSAREDRGPSLLISPDPDPVTRHDCEQHSLVLFHGTCLDFIQYCEEIAPDRREPYELIPEQYQTFLPESVPKSSKLSFWSDFELVPNTAPKNSELSRFQYGHPPSWSDLSSDLDISRPVTGIIVTVMEKLINGNPGQRKLLVVLDATGTGKTTILNRCAFELARRGISTLRCTALSRLEPAATARMLDLIDEPVAIVVDNFADQVTPISDMLKIIKKKNFIVLAAERLYRQRYVVQALAGVRFKKFDASVLVPDDVGRLIDKYVENGLVGSHRAIKNRKQFTNELANDPIAVACCRILNDFRPLDAIISGILKDSDVSEQNRYVMTALAQHCHRAGIRYSVLSDAAGSDGLREQVQKNHPLPLAYYNDGSNSFVVPQNSTLADRILHLTSERGRSNLLNIFVALANAIAPRVNRNAIKRRIPEARLAGRLFDFDDVVEVFLREDAASFYAQTQNAWQWNSRYWEQCALLRLANYYQEPNTSDGLAALELAVQHARHAVSIELHPLSLTTLGQTLLAQMVVDGFSLTATYGEAFEMLRRAIGLERTRARMAIQPFVTLFRGTIQFIENGGELSGNQTEEIRELMKEAYQKFPNDGEIKEVVCSLEKIIS